MKKLSKYKKLTQNIVLITISNFGSKIISFFLMPLYTFNLSTSDYGKVDLINSLVSLLVPIITLNIQDSVLRYGLDDDCGAKESIKIAIIINFIANTFLGVVLFGLYRTHIIQVEIELIVFFFLMFSFTAMTNSLTMYLKASDKVRVMAVSSILYTVLTCIMNVIFLIVFSWGIKGYLLANVVGMCFYLLVMYLGGNVYDIHKEKVLLRNVHGMIKYSLPLVLNSIAWWINNACDRFILSYMRGVSANGIYAVSYKIPTILSTLQSVFYNAWSISAITEFDKNDSDGFIGKIYSLYSGVSCMGCSIIILFNIQISKILYAKDFFEAWTCVPFLLIGTLFHGLSLFIGCLYTSVRKTNIISHTTILGAVVNFFLNIVLIDRIGIVGAAFATMLGYFVTWTARILYLKNVIVMKVNWKSQIMCYLLLVTQSIVATISTNQIIQWVLIIFICILQRKFILLFFKRLTIGMLFR